MARTRVVLDHAAVGRLLRSAEVERALLDRGERVKSAAEAHAVQVQREAERIPMPYQVRSDPSSTRARVYVIAAHPAGLAAEAKYGTLLRSLDAAQ